VDSNPSLPSIVETLPAVLDLVKERTGVDFTRYRQSTMQRRVQNHMVSTGVSVPADYLAFLHGSNDATDALLERLTIKVSSFYRNPLTFDELRSRVLPELAASRPGAPLNIWCAGCGRGEEAYTLAMLLDEAALDGTVIATDIDAGALRAAVAGVYEPHSIASLPSDLVERYLEPLEINGRTAWRAPQSLTSRIRFARHNVTVDPIPEPGLFDLLCCRNVLIYLQREPHQSALHRLRASVADGGYLCLGEAEWPSSDVMKTLVPLARKTRLFRAKSL
jgi:chemotaxis methyl-accepting protein methylase